MAAIDAVALEKRYGGGYYYYSPWNNWARWVVLGVIIFIVFALVLAGACISARRRRRMGVAPYYGTGWTAGHGQAAYYNNNNQNYAQPAPPYQETGTSPYTGYYGNNQQTQGVELQQPQNAYQPGDNMYAPPQGPPPSWQKGDVVH